MELDLRYTPLGAELFGWARWAMAFCNSCGATLEAGAQFCPKCGTAIPMADALSPALPSVPPTRAQGSGALKLVLIIVAVIVVVGIVGICTLIFVVRRVAHNSHIQNKDGKVRAE